MVSYHQSDLDLLVYTQKESAIHIIHSKWVVTSACSLMNLRCMKFPMAPESTMAVDLIDSANVIGAVRCLMSWYRVIADMMSTFSEL